MEQPGAVVIVQGGEGLLQRGKVEICFVVIDAEVVIGVRARLATAAGAAEADGMNAPHGRKGFE